MTTPLLHQEEVEDAIDKTNEEQIVEWSNELLEWAKSSGRDGVWAGHVHLLQYASEILIRIADKDVVPKRKRMGPRTVGEEGRGSWDRPEHYGGEENPFEPIKIIEHYDLNFNLGNVIKYVLRSPFKGTPLKDLKKAYTFIGFEIRRRERNGETE